jgi:23S rRNA (pseudouridine1915-N3)-methyltransferase
VGAGEITESADELSQRVSAAMRVIVATVGRMKQGPEQALAERYRKRAADLSRKLGLSGPDIIEIRESRADNTGRRLREESIAIAKIIPDRAMVVTLDERGEDVASVTLASRLQAWRGDGRSAAVFVIGGSDGLDACLRDQATLSISFGTATWPHQLVRIMLLEQLYRVATILSGHPYHRD